LADPSFPDVIIHTDVASLIQKQRTPPWVNRHILGARVWMTFVTVGEAVEVGRSRNWGERNHGIIPRARYRYNAFIFFPAEHSR